VIQGLGSTLLSHLRVREIVVSPVGVGCTENGVLPTPREKERSRLLVVPVCCDLDVRV
jgi:hypothetical protein